MCMRIMHDLVGDVVLLQSDRVSERGMEGGMWVRCKSDGHGSGGLED